MLYRLFVLPASWASIHGRCCQRTLWCLLLPRSYTSQIVAHCSAFLPHHALLYSVCIHNYFLESPAHRSLPVFAWLLVATVYLLWPVFPGDAVFHSLSGCTASSRVWPGTASFSGSQPTGVCSHPIFAHILRHSPDRPHMRHLSGYTANCLWAFLRWAFHTDCETGSQAGFQPSLLLPVIWFAHFPDPACPSCVSFTSCVLLPAPSPHLLRTTGAVCERLSRSLSTVSWSDPRRPSGFPTCLFGSTYLFSFVASQEILGSPKFLSLLSTHATLFVTPADPPNAHHFAFFVLASDFRISSPSAFLDCLSVLRGYRGYITLQEVRSSLWPMLFPVHASELLFDSWYHIFVSLLSRLIGFFGILPPMPRFSLSDGHSFNRP